MGRLIDTGRIVYSWQVDADGQMHDGVTLESIIKKTPTAYDLEAVIKELQETNKNLCDHIICCKEKCCDICVVNNFLSEQIEIVRKGGVKND